MRALDAIYSHTLAANTDLFCSEGDISLDGWRDVILMDGALVIPGREGAAQ